MGEIKAFEGMRKLFLILTALAAVSWTSASLCGSCENHNNCMAVCGFAGTVTTGCNGNHCYNGMTPRHGKRFPTDTDLNTATLPAVPYPHQEHAHQYPHTTISVGSPYPHNGKNNLGDPTP